MLRVCELLRINLPAESSVDELLSASYTWLEFLFDAVIYHSVRQSGDNCTVSHSDSTEGVLIKSFQYVMSNNQEAFWFHLGEDYTQG